MGVAFVSTACSGNTADTPSGPGSGTGSGTGGSTSGSNAVANANGTVMNGTGATNGTTGTANGATTGTTNGTANGAATGQSTAPGANGTTTSGTTNGVAPNCGMAVEDPTVYPACPMCNGGRCVPNAEIQADVAPLLADCDASSKCVPENLVAQGENALLKPCTSAANAEGRCISVCVPAASEQSGRLPQDVCDPGELCAPCYNPIDGSATGLCDFPCDSGPSQPPVVFDKCCAGDGLCVPRADVPEEQRDLLGPETCPANVPDPVCVPSKILTNPEFMFEPCTTTVAIYPNLPGVCAPKCIVDGDPRGPLLNQGSCALSTDKCVPCNDPSTGMPTGACNALP